MHLALTEAVVGQRKAIHRIRLIHGYKLWPRLQVGLPTSHSTWPTYCSLTTTQLFFKLSNFKILMQWLISIKKIFIMYYKKTQCGCLWDLHLWGLYYSIITLMYFITFSYLCYKYLIHITMNNTQAFLAMVYVYQCSTLSNNSLLNLFVVEPFQTAVHRPTKRESGEKNNT